MNLFDDGGFGEQTFEAGGDSPRVAFCRSLFRAGSGGAWGRFDRSAGAVAAEWLEEIPQ